MKKLIAVTLYLFAYSPYLMLAQQPAVPLPAAVTAPDAPTLTDLQKSQIQAAAQLVEVHRLRARVAALEYESVMSNFRSMIEGFQVPGYTLEPSTLTYTKTAAPENP